MANETSEYLFDAVVNYQSQGASDAIDDAQTLDDLIQSLSEGASINLDVAVEDSELTALEDLDGQTYSPSVEPTVDGEELAALENLDNEAITPEVDPKTSSEGQNLLETLHELGINPVQVVMNIAGNVIDLIGTIENLTVEPFLSLEDAVAKFNAQTGNALPNARELFGQILADDLGTSIEQIGEVATKAAQLHLPIDEATRAALTFTHTWTEENPSTVIEALGVTVSTKLVPNLQDAADLMAVFFQQGGNVGGDALQVVKANSQEWADAGLNLQQALSFLSSFQQGTGATATDAAKAFQTFDDAFTTAASDPTSAQAKFLAANGLDNPKEMGKAIGAETVDGFVEAFTTLPSDQQDAAASLFFGKGGKKFTGAIEGVTTDFDPYKNYKDAATDAATEIDDTLHGVIDDFVTAINGKVAELMSSEAIDLPGKVAALKTGLQAALTTLQEGGSIEDAITVGLKPLGFDDEFQKLESIFGNLVISFLQIIADIQSLLGKDNSGTKAEITRLGAQQLAFDLKVGNPDDIAADIATAVDRGVTPEAIATAASSAVTELVKQGATEQAQLLTDGLKTGGSIRFDFSGFADKAALSAAGITQDVYTVPISPEWSEEDVAKFVADQTSAFKQGGFNPNVTVIPTVDQADIDALQKQVNDAVEAAKPVVDLSTGKNAQGIGFGAAGGNNIAAPTTYADIAGDDLKAGLDAAATSFSDVTTKAKDYHSQAELLALANTEGGQSFIDMIANAQQAADAVDTGGTTMAEAMQAADESITNSISGNTIIEEFNKMSAKATSESEATVEALNSINQVKFDDVENTIDRLIAKVRELGNSVASTIAAAGKLPASGSAAAAGSTTNVSVTNNNNVQSNAQAHAIGQTTADGIRGFA